MKEVVRRERSVYNDFELEAATTKEAQIQDRKRKFPPSHKYDLPEYFSAADEQTIVDSVVNDSYIPFKPIEVSHTDKQSVSAIKPFSSVYLVVETAEKTWDFPRRVVGSEASLHESSMSFLGSHPDNKNLKVQLHSRIPISVHVNKYSKTYQEHTKLMGVKTFFMKCSYVDGNFEGERFRWCTKEELGELVDKNVLKCVEPCLQ